jgi:hypothetical protein
MGMIVIVAAVLLLLFVLTFGCFAGTELLKVPNRAKAKTGIVAEKFSISVAQHNRCRSLFAKTKPHRARLFVFKR